MSSRPSDYMLTRPGPLRLYSTPELLKLPPPTWLIDTIVPAGGLVGLYGPPDHGKSFVALGMALAVATGRPWHGHDVVRGFVLYVSAEGGKGISKRVAAWLARQHCEPKDPDIAWLTEAITVLADSEDLNRLLDRLEEEVFEHPTFIVIDTLARCFEGEESETGDMGRFVQGVDRLRREYGATVLVVHHTRLRGDRERGNTAFRCATDAMISVFKRGKHQIIITLSNDKQRDAAEFDDIELRLLSVPAYNTCVLERPRRHENDENTACLLKILKKYGSLSSPQWCQFSGLSKSVFYRTLVGLKKKAVIIEENRHWKRAVPQSQSS